MAPAVQQYSSFFQCLYDQPRAPNGGSWGGYSIFRAIDSRDVCQRPTKRPRVHDFAVLWDEDHDTRVIEVVEEMLMAGMLPGVQFIGEHQGGITVILAAPTYDIIDHKAYAERVGGFADLVHQDYWHCDIGKFNNTGTSLRTKHNVDLGDLRYPDEATAHAYLLTIDRAWQLGTKEYVSADTPKDSLNRFGGRYRMSRTLDPRL